MSGSVLVLLESAESRVRIPDAAPHLRGYIRETIETPCGCIRYTETAQDLTVSLRVMSIYYVEGRTLRLIGSGP